jgi:putative membrane protein
VRIGVEFQRDLGEDGGLEHRVSREIENRRKERDRLCSPFGDVPRQKPRTVAASAHCDLYPYELSPQVQYRNTPMLVLKAFHIVFMVTWFAGLFYLPRLFVYHAQTSDALSLDRFVVMERRLFVMMTIGAVLTAVFGIAMLISAPGMLYGGWLHAKLFLVAILIAYHVWCYRLLVALRNGRNRHTDRWYRIFNEIPSLLLIAIVLLVVLKPF